MTVSGGAGGDKVLDTAPAVGGQLLEERFRLGLKQLSARGTARNQFRPAYLCKRSHREGV